jgi:hypothetical protein
MSGDSFIVKNLTILKNNQTVLEVLLNSDVTVFTTLITIFGVLTNFINIIIFSDKKFKDKTFTYLLYFSISEFLYQFLLILSTITFCGNYCSDSFRYSLIPQLIKLYSDEFLTSCLAIFSISIEITIVFLRYLVVSNKSFCKIIKEPFKFSIILFFISFLFYSPIIIAERIIKKYADQNIYHVVNTMDGKLYRYYSYITVIIRGPICTMLLTVINLITLINFRKQMDKKKAIRSKSSNILLFLKFLEKLTIILLI